MQVYTDTLLLATIVVLTRGQEDAQCADHDDLRNGVLVRDACVTLIKELHWVV